MIKKNHKQVIAFIEKYSKEKGFPPSTQEIAEGVGSYPSIVGYQIKSLTLKGYLSYIPGKQRTLRVIKKPEDAA